MGKRSNANIPTLQIDQYRKQLGKFLTQTRQDK